MAIRSRAVRERERRRKAKRNRSQLLGATQGGQRRPMQQGYTTTSVQPPPFRESTVGADITQAGLAFKGGKGLHEFATGTEGGYNKEGVWVEGKEPWSIGGEKISDKLGNYFEGVGDRVTNTGRDFKSLFDTQQSPQELAQLERANIGFGSNQGLLGPKPPPQWGQPNISQGYNVADLEAAKLGAYRGTGGGPLSTTMQFQTPTSGLQGNLLGGADSAFAGAGAATGMSSLNAPMNAAASFGQGLGGEAALSNLFSGGGAPQGMGHLAQGSSIGGWGNQAANLQGSLGGSEALGTLNQAGTGIEAGTSTAGSGLQGGGGGHPYLAYANIGKDLFMGGPQSQKITGSTAGDAALRAAAAYYTMGLSEIPYAFF